VSFVRISQIFQYNFKILSRHNTHNESIQEFLREVLKYALVIYKETLSHGMSKD